MNIYSPVLQFIVSRGKIFPSYYSIMSGNEDVYGK